MDKIEIRCMNPEALGTAEKTAAFAARLTQRGHVLNSMQDVMDLYEKDFTPGFMEVINTLPHPTLQKFAVINYMVVGASRRFLAQVTRHQNEVKFMSGSLQYSDYKDSSQFCVPYELIELDRKRIGSAEFVEGYHTNNYINSCTDAMLNYRAAREQGVGNDTCGYMAPQGLRNVLLISATPYQWKHMIKQRICKRNTPETRFVFLKIWEDLQRQSTLFSSKTTLPDCCNEGNMSCNDPFYPTDTATDILHSEFPYIV